MGGVDLATIKDLLGHNDFKMTLRYSHLAPAHKTAAIAILENALNGNPNCTITAQSPPKAISSHSYVPEKIGADGRD